MKNILSCVGSYILQNDYNTNLMKILYEYEKKKIEIIDIKKNVFGMDPLFCPIQLLFGRKKKIELNAKEKKNIYHWHYEDGRFVLINLLSAHSKL